jgi:putative oxidoreductase
MKDLALLTLRLTLGGLLAGHGAQKLYGWFGGHGLEGTGRFLEGLGLKSGQRWAKIAGASELGGGMLTALGLGGPIGPIATVAPMVTATSTVHWGKPIWNSEGGAELPVTNVAIASALALCGPGRISLDYLYDVRIPHWMSVLTLNLTAAGVAYALTSRALAMIEQEKLSQRPTEEQIIWPEPASVGETGSGQRSAA